MCLGRASRPEGQASAKILNCAVGISEQARRPACLELTEPGGVKGGEEGMAGDGK